MKNLLTIWFVLIGFTLSLNAQSGWNPGTVYLKSGQKLTGTIADEEAYLMFEFAEFRDAGGKKTTYSPKDLIKYEIDGGFTYVSGSPALSEKFVKKQYFFKLIVDGAMQLFELRTPTTTAYFTKKGAGEMQPLFRTASRNVSSSLTLVDTVYDQRQALEPGKYTFTNQYIKTLNEAFSDLNTHKPHHIAFKAADFIKEVEAYNKAMNPATFKVIKVATKPRVLYFGLAGSYALERKTPYRVFRLYEQWEARDPLAGFQGFVGITMPKVSKRLSMELAFSSLGASAQGSRFYLTDTVEYVNTARILTPELRLRAHLLATQKISPYVTFGAGVSIIDSEVRNRETNEVLVDVPLLPTYFIMTGGAGVEYIPKPKHLIQLGLNSAVYSEYGLLPSVQLGYAYRFQLK